MVDKIYTLDDFQFHLPEELIAQEPAIERDESRLFVLDRRTGREKHLTFHEITSCLRENDLMVFNNVRVISARIFMRRETGGFVEIVLARRLSVEEWLVISNRTARLHVGETLTAAKDPSISMTILGREGDFLKVKTVPVLTRELLDAIGAVPLPPYIRRESGEKDRDRYQTVYAERGEAAAAPTAGLHFTTNLMDRIRSIGVEISFLTLDVSWGTFQPVRQNDLSLHQMHMESFDLPAETADAVNGARAGGRRIIAVGTTSLRVLEATFNGERNIAGSGATDIFIYPPRKVHSATGLLTNFHTPGSTLLMLVCAFAGYDRIMHAYNNAVAMGYRFFSYGDAMLIE